MSRVLDRPPETAAEPVAGPQELARPPVAAGRPRLWLWPNLLSLDAPLVAVLWQALFARCFGVPFSLWEATLLLCAVWLIYSADRMLDAWRGESAAARHRFYGRHWRALLPVWFGVLGISAWLARTALPEWLFRRGLGLLAAVLAYFVLVHARIERRWPKEAAVGLLFALGASAVAWNKVATLADAVAILLFSCLCWMNCIAIQRWEERRIEWSASLAAVSLACAAAVLCFAHRPVLGGAEAASALAFIALDRRREQFSIEALRVLADAALLSPVIFLPVLR